MNWQTDPQYREYVVEKTNTSGDWHEFCFDGGWWTGVKADSSPLPQVGERIRLYPGDIGRPNRGLAVERDGEWQINWYRSEEQDRIHHEISSVERNLKNLRKLYDEVDERRERIAALPEAFRQRLAHFAELGGIRYRADNEAYELFVCEEAVRIAGALGTIEALTAFCARDLSWEEQQEAVPGLSDQHSGNTFGAACYLARCHLEGKHDAIARVDHGALAPLAGSYKSEVEQVRDVVRTALRSLDQCHPARALLLQAVADD